MPACRIVAIKFFFSLMIQLIWMGNDATAQVSILEHTYGESTAITYNGTAGTNRLLLVVVTAEFSGADQVNSITWGDKSLTAIASVSSGSSIVNYTAAFYLKESDIAAHSGSTITLNCASGGSNIRSITGEVIMLSGVLQSAPISEYSTATAGSANSVALSSSISSDNKDLIIAAVCSNRNNLTFTTGGTGFTELADVQASQHSYSVSYRSALSSPTTSDPSFTGSNSSIRLTMLAFEINSTFDPLPVELLQLQATYKCNKLTAIWSVATETENDFFTLEGSVDGEVWSWLGKKSSTGNTNHARTYTFQLNTGQHFKYLRLSQTDIDGTTTILAHSPIKFDFSGTLSLSDFVNILADCKARNIDGKTIVGCSSCFPSDFLKEQINGFVPFILEISIDQQVVFNGFVATADI